MRRREFITLLGGAAAAWPLKARAAQQTSGLRRIGVLMALASDTSEAPAQRAAFEQALQQLGWVKGGDIRIDYRWGAGDINRVRRYAAELVARSPDVILSAGSTNLKALQETTRSLPIVFVAVTDPVGAGFVASLPHPGANITGFSHFDYSISAKWLELLKQIAPAVTHVAVLRNPVQASGIGQLGAISSAAASVGVELDPVDIRDVGEIERAVTSLARLGNGGLIVPSSALAAVHRELIITLAAKHRLPAVYFRRPFVTAGGLISYGPDAIDHFRRAAGYVDRILKGAKPADLPVQAPTKYELVINLKTAKALGLEVPPTLLARADEVIE
jgi:putative ABC transport system substrate-binding protein